MSVKYVIIGYITMTAENRDRKNREYRYNIVIDEIRREFVKFREYPALSFALMEATFSLYAIKDRLDIDIVFKKPLT